MLKNVVNFEECRKNVYGEISRFWIRKIIFCQQAYYVHLLGFHQMPKKSSKTKKVKETKIQSLHLKSKNEKKSQQQEMSID